MELTLKHHSDTFQQSNRAINGQAKSSKRLRTSRCMCIQTRHNWVVGRTLPEMYVLLF